MLTLRATVGVLSLSVLVACGDDGTGSGGGGEGGAGATSATSGSGSTTTSGTSSTSSATGTGGAAPSQCDGGPLSAPIQGCAPAPLPTTGDPGQDCVDRINQLRWECQCLPPLERWTDVEMCTDAQSADDQAANSPHGNFPACGENAQNTCPNWGSVGDVIGGCLQMMWDEGPGEPFSEHGHYLNMSSTQFKRVACGFSDSGAGVWANQNFAP